MAVLDDLGVFMQANGFGTLGQTIFLSTLPQDQPGANVQDQVLLLSEVPGLPAEHSHDIRGPAVEQAHIQLRWRGSPYGYAAIRSQAQSAYVLLDGIVNEPINGAMYQRIQALQGPFGLAQDQWNRPFVLFTVRCSRDASAS